MPVVKYLPEWFPGADFKKRAREGFVIAREVLNKPYSEAKMRYVRDRKFLFHQKSHNTFLVALHQFDGTCKPCATSQLIEENIDVDGNIKDEDVIAATVGMLYIGKTFSIFYLNCFD